ncbi:hypothetical protein K470DRAFT_272323 [Piedraia hortae CBS 480.64]|uniref:Uncharacterized protein n=1 Tax=Piedraia hortae CBS 480.64 TaxID=1314780 RepID=A0A6A7BU16_9PEZI|nr:hypothetical protein K470DRAFT_272323 [Piedraia hortae CBS 480.64]
MQSALLTPLTNTTQTLTRLAESISAYNPSVSTCTTLVTQTDELEDALASLHQHQILHTRKGELQRDFARGVDEGRDVTRRLIELRRELISIVGLGREGEREVELGEVLGFGGGIARGTGFRGNDKRGEEGKNQDGKDDKGESFGDTSTPYERRRGGYGTSPPPPKPHPDVIKRGIITEVDERFLGRAAARVVQPWPSVDQIFSGNLVKVQKRMEAEEEAAAAGVVGDKEKKSFWEEEGGGYNGAAAGEEEDVFDPDA